METPAGGQYVFTTATAPVDVFLTPTSPLADPGTGGNAFDLEIFTVTNKGTSDPGFEGSAFVPGGTINASGRVVGPSVELNNGDFWVTDFGGNDTIQAGSGSQTVTGGVATTILGGTGTLNVVAGNLDVVSIAGASAATVNAAGAGTTGERVVIGANAATVYANNNDQIIAGNGVGTLVFGSSANLTVQGHNFGSFAVNSASEGAIGGVADLVNVTGIAGDTITLHGTIGATVNAFAGSQFISFSGPVGPATVYASKGDTVAGNLAGFDAGIVVIGDSVTVNDSLILKGNASANTLVVGTTAFGAVSVNADSVNLAAFGAGDTISTDSVAAVTVNALDVDKQTVLLGSGVATVYAGAGDSVSAGTGTGILVFGADTVSQTFLTVTGASAAGNILVADSAGTFMASATTASITGAANSTITATDGGIVVNAIAGNDLVQIAGGGKDSVLGGTGDTIGVAPSGLGTSTGFELFLDSSIDGAGAVGFGTFATSSSATVQVGTVVGGAASEGFDSVSGDFIFYQNPTAGQTNAIIASAVDVNVGGVTSTTFALPDGTTMVLIGVTSTSLTAGLFRAAPA